MAQITSTAGRSTYRDTSSAGRRVERVVRPDPRQAMHAVRTLRRSLARLELPDAIRAEAASVLDAIEDDLRVPDPDRALVAVRLRRVTELLLDANVLTSAGATVIRPLRAIATWLGPIGAALTPRSA